jgi:hypothetical protein
VAYVWRRQAGKSYLLGNQALDWMMQSPGSLTTIISAALALGTEVIMKEAQAWRAHLDRLRAVARASRHQLETNADGTDLEAFGELFKHSKLEARIKHPGTAVSRTRVIAPNPSTAVGWTGHIIADEFGRWPNCREVLEAIEPFMESNPQFQLRLATTPPPDDKHYSYEMLLPPAGQVFQPSATGNFYRSSGGLLVHRVDAWDAALAGVAMHHPEHGAPIAPDAHRALAPDKAAWDRNYGLKFLPGGIGAVSLANLARAMDQGRTQCEAVNITEEITL